MKFKKLSLLSVLIGFALILTSCGGNVLKPIVAETEITLWTYPIGNWQNGAVLDKLIADFNAVHPQITVKYDFLDYTTGDSKVELAIKAGAAPDIILEGPERLVANWGERGLMADLSDLYTDASKDIYENVVLACRGTDGNFYEYPLCMATHCMAINKRIFEEADALKYLDLENYTWTTENFFKAINAVYESGHKDIIALYCKTQGGDQGTRALINNLYEGSFTDSDHSTYTVNTKNNADAINALIEQKGIEIRPDITSAEEIDLFRRGELAVSICWNVSHHNDTTLSPATMTDNGDEIIPMHFPSPSGNSRLNSGIWGFGVFDNGDNKKISAAKLFINFMANDATQVKKAVKETRFFPVHKELKNVYEGTPVAETMELFSNNFMMSMGDYYQITPGWAVAREEWYKMLQEIKDGKKVSKALNDFTEAANKAAVEAVNANKNAH